MNQSNRHPLLDDPKWEELTEYMNERDKALAMQSIIGSRSWPMALWAWYRTMTRVYELAGIHAKLGTHGWKGE